MRRLLLALTTAGLVVAGCGQSENDASPQNPTPTISEPTSPTPSQESSNTQRPQDLWQESVAGTLSASAVDLEAQLITNVEGFERVVVGNGYVEVNQGFGDITWTDDFGTSREVITDTGHFLELDDLWLEVAPESPLPTTVAFTPLAGLAGATNVVLSGSEEINGRPTMRLDADLDPGDGSSLMGFSEEERTVFAETSDASLIATIWIDADGQIVRVLREYRSSSQDADPISATSLFLLADHGRSRPLDVPETSEAIPAPV